MTSFTQMEAEGGRDAKLPAADGGPCSGLARYCALVNSSSESRPS
jgi:hypothetical protein